MSDELNIAGVSYVSSKRAAQVSGYAQDYIGQLCRAGHIQAQRVGGLWYLNLDSLYEYKKKADSYTPSAPRKESAADSETLVSFDGKDYISATRAAEITGYHQDYVGQLAREGKVLSRQVGNRWYVERAGIKDHKRQKDALLAAVQVEAVGIPRSQLRDGNEKTPAPNEVHSAYFTYSKEEDDLLPVLSDTKDPLVEESTPSEELPLEAAHSVPIRIVRDSSEQHTSISQEIPRSPGPRNKKFSLKNLVAVPVATVVVILGLGYASIHMGARYAENTESINSRENSLALVTQAIGILTLVGDFLESIVSSELVYRRE